MAERVYAKKAQAAETAAPAGEASPDAHSGEGVVDAVDAEFEEVKDKE